MTPKLQYSITPLLLLCALCVSALRTHAQSSPDVRFQRFDKNGDGTILREEAKGTAVEQRFDALDKNKDSFLTPDETPRGRGAAQSADAGDPGGIVTKMDLRYAEVPPGADANHLSLTPFRTAPDAAPQWPIGFQVVYPVSGKTLSNHDAESYILKDDAWYLLRDEQANYTLHRIRSDRCLFLARDFKPSPFPEEPQTLYACGYNGSYFKGSLGTAWIFKGNLKGQ